MIINEIANECLKIIMSKGYSAYFVGGCVRDTLMGEQPNDIDIATNATSESIIDIFEKVIPTGVKYGTVTVVYKGIKIEVTQFRTDGNYENNRKPETVNFIDNINKDLLRRDFTVNAIAYNPVKGLVDPYGGVEDISSKTLRCVGEPDTRFNEDALRIMRLFRFSCTKGFKIEEKTLHSAIKNRQLLQNISIERIYNELIKTINGAYLYNIHPLINSGALGFVGINTCVYIDKLININESHINSVKLYWLIKMCNGNIRLFVDRSKLSNKLVNELENLRYADELKENANKYAIKSLLNKIEPNVLLDFLAVKNKLTCDKYIAFTDLTNEVIINNEPYKLKHLALNGEDLKQLGYSGQEIGKKLAELLEIVKINPKKNKREMLLTFL